MSIDYSTTSLVLALGLFAGATCFGFCLRAVTSKPWAPAVQPSIRPSPPGVQEWPPPVQDWQQWHPPAAAPAPPGAPSPTNAPPPATAGGRDQLMIRELIGAYDTFETEGVRIYLTQALKRAGVTKVEPVAGTRFDPDLFKSMGTVAAESPSQHMLVAATNRPGWRDVTGVELRQPEVTVYSWEASR